MPEYTPNYNGGRPMTAPPVNAFSEYTRAFPATRAAPRPRNPVPTWSTRNRSNILPSGPELPQRGASSQETRLQQQWPWQGRAARSEIFDNPINADANNNPAPLAVRADPPQHYYRFQTRGQTSSGVLFFDRQVPQSTEVRPARPTRNWPWQDRSMQSKIFQLPEEKQRKTKAYQWDQRKSSPFFKENDPDSEPESNSTGSKKIPKIWPWQERAKQSHIFKPLDKTSKPCKRYPWDQRQSVFDIKDDRNAKFECVSGYTEDFIKTQTDLSSIEAAGIKSYQTLEALKNLNMNSARTTVSSLTEEDHREEAQKNIVPLFNNSNHTTDSTTCGQGLHFRDLTNSQNSSRSLTQGKREVDKSRHLASQGIIDSENQPPTYC